MQQGTPLQQYAPSQSGRRAGRSGKKIKIAHRKTQLQTRLFFTAAAVLFLVCISFLDLSWKQFHQGISSMPDIASKLMTISFEPFVQLVDGMLTSLIIAFLTVVLSVVISILLSFLIAENITPVKWLGRLLRYVLLIIRTIPTTIWVLLAVASMGFGSMAGVLGLLFPTSSYLIKAFAAQIEESSDDTIEAMRSVGASWLQIVFKGLLPGLILPFLAIISFRFEMEVAETVMLGMVGAGGIGVLLQDYISYYEFADLAMGIVIVFITIFAVELISNRVRSKLARR
ncbi:phosphonate transport system permease protein [Paenibacillus phyllosphaerae]|uniref:Phosphonate transport system permease protein n=1 Tax=Paenibacillus phyllosphaerae TaxID=274593 RepID=A0A7W5B3Y4_9BACL|nr:ABC transporter permease subunit [Paenibacillus phyllosphaerae]MBB3113947.1 phosphonate transport system permease protein [Paenibacillus phyllosphaerae]